MGKDTKKAFGKIFKVMCDSTYYPTDADWESLIAKTTNNGWNNPSTSFRSTGNTPNIEGTIMGFYIPPSSQKDHPKFAFIKSKKGLFALKFWWQQRSRKDKGSCISCLFLYGIFSIYYKITTSHCACSWKYFASSKLPIIES